MKRVLFILTSIVAYGISMPDTNAETGSVYGMSLIADAGAAEDTAERIELGRLATGAITSFIRDASGMWGLEIAGGQIATFMQPKPVQIELYRSDADIRQIATGYDAVKQQNGIITGQATIDAGGGACFLVTDQWTMEGNILTLNRPSMTNPPVWYVREATEDMRMLMEAYRRESKEGRDHPEWIRWCKDFSDWLIRLQRDDGSFPRSFMIQTSEIEEQSGTTSYNVVPLFVMLSQDLGDNKYLNSALRAAEYVWQSFGTRGVFIGGAIDNPNITDKEAGLLSMEAFLFLYEETKEPKWLSRAKVAGDFAESWMWIWNVPMPEDANDSALMWKRNVTTVGVQGITAQVAGHVDQYLDWSVPAYAKLYRYTGDNHYRELARILLHNCKGMMAMPGRTYGMIGPGWQTENWRMGASHEGRGFGTPEKWMPWVTTNHLYSITGLEQYDKELLIELSAKP